MSKPVQTVFIVDDDPSYRRSLERLLGASGYAVACFGSARDFLARCPQGATGCVLADLKMPEMDGLALQEALGASTNPLPFVFITGHGDVRSSVLAMRRGAEDFLIKTASKGDVISAVERALARDVRERKARVRRHELQSRLDNLTPRESQVLSHVLKGQRNKEIATDLRIDERSVKRHRTNLMRKLEVKSVAELTQLALEAGFHAAE